MVSDLNILVWKWSKIAVKKNADFAIQTIMETTLPDGLDTSGQREYRSFWHISGRF